MILWSILRHGSDSRVKPRSYQARLSVIACLWEDIDFRPLGLGTDDLSHDRGDSIYRFETTSDLNLDLLHDIRDNGHDGGDRQHVVSWC